MIKKILFLPLPRCSFCGRHNATRVIVPKKGNYNLKICPDCSTELALELNSKLESIKT